MKRSYMNDRLCQNEEIKQRSFIIGGIHPVVDKDIRVVRAHKGLSQDSPQKFKKSIKHII